MNNASWGNSADVFDLPVVPDIKAGSAFYCTLQKAPVGRQADRGLESTCVRQQVRMNKYDSEVEKCIDNYVRDAVSLPKMLSAMVGQDRELGLVAWSFILAPLALLWIVSSANYRRC